jgi:hypothetical protein
MRFSFSVFPAPFLQAALKTFWMDPGTGLGLVERRITLPLPGLELQPLGRPARNQSLYRLTIPGAYATRGTEVLAVLSPHHGEPPA